MNVTNKLAEALRRLVNTFPIPVDGVEQSDRVSLRLALFTAREALAAYEAEAKAGDAEPVAWLCRLGSEYSGSTLFFTAPSDPRGFPVYATPAAPAPITRDEARALLIERAQKAKWPGDPAPAAPAPWEPTDAELDALMPEEVLGGYTFANGAVVAPVWTQSQVHKAMRAAIAASKVGEA